MRRQAAKTLDEYLRDNRLTPAQLSLLRTYPEVPTLEQRRRKEYILANWAIHFPALDQALRGTRFKTTGLGREDWNYEFGGLFGRASSNDDDPGKKLVVEIRGKE